MNKVCDSKELQSDKVMSFSALEEKDKKLSNLFVFEAIYQMH